MATAIQTPDQVPAQTTLDQYLQTTGHPDCEYIDGNIEERDAGKWQHARLQRLIANRFGQHEKEWACIGSTEQRIRIPDLVIEILSPEDTCTSFKKRARDDRAMGVRDIWIIDPETRAARTTLGESWQAATHLEVPNSPIHLDHHQLFARLDETASPA